MPDTKPDYMVMLDKKTCPAAHLHDPEVEYGIEADDPAKAPTTFSAWAKEKSKTHRQRKCPGCGLWKIWEPQ